MSLPKGNRVLAEQKFQQGLHQLELKEYQNALKFFSWAIAECPEVDYFYMKRSDCYLAMDEHVRALSDAENVAQITRGHVGARQRVAQCFEYLEKDAAAKAPYRKVVINALNELSESRGRIKHLMGSNQIKECLKVVDDALEISPANKNNTLTKMRLLIIEGRQTEADMLHENVFKNHSDQNYYEAFKLYYNGKFEASAKMLDQLMKNMPFSYEAAGDIKKKANKIKMNLAKGMRIIK